MVGINQVDLVGEKKDVPKTRSPIIMVQWKITLNERKLTLEGPIFHFHDYGRKGMCVISIDTTYIYYLQDLVCYVSV